MDKDRIVGAGKQMIGAAKQVVGKLSAMPSSRSTAREQVDGKLQNAVGSVKDTLRR